MSVSLTLVCAKPQQRKTHRLFTTESRLRVCFGVCVHARSFRYKKTMGEQLFGVDAQRAVLPLAGSGGIRSLTKQASAASTSLLAISPVAPFASSPAKQHRTIGRAPVHILDAPEMLEDYYLNLLDWSRTYTVGVALNKAVYLWQASTGRTSARERENSPSND